MKIYHDSALLVSELRDKYLFLDTNALINAFAHQQEFGEILKSLKDHNCALLIIPSVSFEFSRTFDMDAFRKRTEFIENLVDIYAIEKHLDQMEEALFVFQKLGNHMSYTDFLLCMCLYKFKEKAYLLTENHKDMPLSIVDRNIILTFDDGKEIRNSAIYQLSQEKFEKAVLNILGPQPF